MCHPERSPPSADGSGRGRRSRSVSGNGQQPTPWWLRLTTAVAPSLRWLVVVAEDGDGHGTQFSGRWARAGSCPPGPAACSCSCGARSWAVPAGVPVRRSRSRSSPPCWGLPRRRVPAGCTQAVEAAAGPAVGVVEEAAQPPGRCSVWPACQRCPRPARSRPGTGPAGYPAAAAAAADSSCAGCGPHPGSGVRSPAGRPWRAALPLPPLLLLLLFLAAEPGPGAWGALWAA